MADLDDFFAKKDRKKSKGKKFMTTDEIAKKLEETGKKSDKSKKDRPIIQSSINIQDGDDISEDEWKNFEEEKKDYTGLKLHNLTIEGSSDSENGDGESDRIIDDNRSVEMVPKMKGPWKMIEQTAKENTKASSEGEGGGGGGGTTKPTCYAPPQMRNQNHSSWNKSRLKKDAPDINNQEFFPTLSAAKNEPPPNWNKKRQDGAFEEVRNSKSHSNRSDPSHRQQNLQIGNKFGALESEHS